MGGKAGSAGVSLGKPASIDAFIAAIAPEHRPTFDVLRTLIRRVAPEALEALKWGTIQYNLDGKSVFALSAPRDVVNLYVLTIGVLAAHREELAGIPHSKCVMRFAAGVKPPISVLTRVLKAAPGRRQLISPSIGRPAGSRV